MHSSINPIESDSAAIEDELSDEAITRNGAGGDRVYTFDDMRLKVGDRLQMQFPLRVAHERTFVRLIGYVSNLCLLVMAPRQPDGLRIHLHEGDELVVRIFSSQNAFGFSARIDKIVKLPFEYLHLSFPKEIKGMQVRKAPRVRTRIICSVQTEHTGEEGLTGILMNMSANGALLVSRQIIAPAGQTIRLAFRFNLHGTEALLNLRAVVRSQFVDENPGSRTPEHHGLEFVDLKLNDVMLLQSMIYQQMIEQPDTVI
jgi:c-di-GMP-binding flagellar brake protein YcgR